MILIAVDPQKVLAYRPRRRPPRAASSASSGWKLVRTDGCCAGRGSGPSAAGPWRGPAVSATASASGCSRRASRSSMSRRGWWRACACSPVAGSPTPQTRVPLRSPPNPSRRCVPCGRRTTRRCCDCSPTAATSSRRNARAWYRLHRLLRELRPGGGPSRLSADRAQALLRRLRPTGAADRERLRMARELVREVRVLDRNLVGTAAASRQRCVYKAAPSRASPASA